MVKDLKRLSKFLAVVLRHRPEDFDIELDDQGYALLEHVWIAIQDKFAQQYDMVDLETVVIGDQDGKKRYEIVGDQIRAMYGHSKPKVIYPAFEPPELLYHGTNPKAVIEIRKAGLLSLGRQYVHMTTNRQLAMIVAQRQTQDSILLVVRAQEAYHEGIVFHRAESEHYLAKSIPPQFIDFPK